MLRAALSNLLSFAPVGDGDGRRGCKEEGDLAMALRSCDAGEGEREAKDVAAAAKMGPTPSQQQIGEFVKRPIRIAGTSSCSYDDAPERNGKTRKGRRRTIPCDGRTARRRSDPLPLITPGLGGYIRTGWLRLDEEVADGAGHQPRPRAPPASAACERV